MPTPVSKFVFVSEDVTRAEAVRRSRGLFPEQVVHVATQEELDALDLAEFAGVVWVDEHLQLLFSVTEVHPAPAGPYVREVFDGDTAQSSDKA